MAGHQRHFVQVGHIPGADDDAARVGVGFERPDDFGNLVDVRAVGLGPAAPLNAVHRAQIAIGTCPLVPDGHAMRTQIVVVAGAGQEPQQLVDDGFEVNLLGRHQRKTLVQVKPHLVAEHAGGARAGAVGLEHPVGAHMANKVFVLGADGVRHANNSGE